MPRKTRRVGKKRRKHTKKRTYVTRKYKFLRGGLGDNYYKNIGIYDKYSFGKEMYNVFETYVFGSVEHAKKWKEILSLCSEKGIPFYILTSGNRLGVIRTLQLLELDDYVTEVLCNNKDTLSNPPHVKREDEDAQIHESFREMNKYQIIEHILRVTSTRQSDYSGIFIDNDERNKDGHELCSNVKFIYATGKNIQKDKHYQSTIFMDYVKNIREDHPLYYVVTRTVIDHMYNMRYTNLVDTSLLDDIIEKLKSKSGEINIIFADFDGTMSPWGGALPFQFPIFNVIFNRHFGVSVTRTL